MQLLLNILFCFWIQESCLSSEFMKCYPNESIYYAVVDKSLAISCDFKLQKYKNQSNLTDNVIWKKNGDIFRPETVLEYLSDNNQRLKIHFLKLSESDSGIYECLYFGNKNIEVSNKIELVVLPNHTDPTCTTSKSKFFVGDNVILVCETYPYPSLNLFWQSPLPSDVVLSNTTNKNKTSSIITFTANRPDAGTKYICTMNTQEGIRFCTSTVVIIRRLGTEIERTRFIINQPATLLCRPMHEDELNSENSTLYKKVRSIPNQSGPLDFEWTSTYDVLLNNSIEQGNASILTIQKVSDEMHRANITCTIILNDAMGSDTITIYIDDGYMVTRKYHTGALKSSTERFKKDNVNIFVGSTESFPNEIIIPMLVSLIFLCQVPLIAIQCLRYLKRTANNNSHSGAHHQTINFDNDTYQTSTPFQKGNISSSTTLINIMPHALQQAAVSNRQCDSTTSVELTKCSWNSNALSSYLSKTEVISPGSPRANANNLNEVLVLNPLYEDINDDYEIFD